MITEEQARGDSPAVSVGEYRAAHARGQWAIARYLRAARVMPFETSLRIVESLREPWGGITLDAHTWQPQERTSGYAVAIAGNFAGPRLWLDIDAAPTRIQEMACEMVAKYPDVPYYGVFRDEDTGRIDFDPVLITDTADDARDIATYCESLGGAYDFATGNGIFPYHVASEDNKQAS